MDPMGRQRLKPDGFGLRDARLESIMYAECSGHTVIVHMRDQTSLQMYDIEVP